MYERFLNHGGAMLVVKPKKKKFGIKRIDEGQISIIKKI